ncbi:MAG: hypothetical protein JJV99_12925 [Colwellia sp.]|nr:hypothetical protein [Colwellia sp.]
MFTFQNKQSTNTEPNLITITMSKSMSKTTYKSSITRYIAALISLVIIFSAATLIWQNYSSNANLFDTQSNAHSLNKDSANNRPINPINPINPIVVSKVDTSWQQDSKTVDLDQYIANNQVSQNIIDKKQRVMLEPELINFYATLQASVQTSKAELVTDSLAVWGISPLPEVGFSTYIRTLSGSVIAVYVENTIADHISESYTPETLIEFQAYRLYNYAKGPRLLLVGVKTADKALVKRLKQQEQQQINSNTENVISE